MDDPAVEPAQNRCRNCGAPLRGEYCHHCGQREGRGELHFADAAGEVFGDLFTWDSRFWRTLLPLVFRPGFLTAEFIAGRRARYVPPFRLYIIVSFVLFLVISLTAGDMVDIEDQDEVFTVTGSESADPNDIAEAQATLDELGIPVDIKERMQGAASENDDVVLAPVIIGDGDADTDDADTDDVDTDDADSDEGLIDLADPNSPPWLQELDQRVENNARSIRDDPGQFVELLLDYLPQMMFLMLPLFALLLQLCYLMSPFHYLQHLVFGLHYHSFVYLLYLIGEAAERLDTAIGGWLFLVLVVYMPLALRRAYGSGIAGALGKSVFLYLGYGVSLLLGFAGVVVLAVVLM